MRILVFATAIIAACAHEPTKPPAPPTAAPEASLTRKAVESPQAPKAIGPYSQAIRAPATTLLFLSGQLPIDPATGQFVQGDIAAQTDRAMLSLKAVLEAAGASLDDLVKTTIFLADLGDFTKVNDAYAKYFHQAPPARATMQMAALPRGARVEIEAIAMTAAGAAAPAGRSPIQSPLAPKAIGPYSQAIQVPAGSLLFVSGQIPIDPATGQLVQGDIVAQTERVMENLKAVLDAAGATFDDVLKAGIFVADLADFAKVNETYGKYFPQAPPARATVQVAALPRSARIEIELVALSRRAPASVASLAPVESAQAPKAIGPYSQAIAVNARSLLFASGQIPIDPVSGQLVQGDIVAQTERVMENLRAVLEGGGAGFDKVVKTTIYLADLADFAKVNETYGKYFQKSPPARATVQVAAVPRSARVEIECIAAPSGRESLLLLAGRKAGPLGKRPGSGDAASLRRDYGSCGSPLASTSLAIWSITKSVSSRLLYMACVLTRKAARVDLPSAYRFGQEREAR